MLVMVPLAVSRMHATDPLVGFQGLLAAVYLGMPLLAPAPQGAAGLAQLWLHVVAPLAAAATAALAATVLVALLVVPSLASERVRAPQAAVCARQASTHALVAALTPAGGRPRCCAQIERGASEMLAALGHMLSSHASYLLAPPADVQVMHPELAGALNVLKRAANVTHVQVGWRARDAHDACCCMHSHTLVPAHCAHRSLTACCWRSATSTASCCWSGGGTTADRPHCGGRAKTRRCSSSSRCSAHMTLCCSCGLGAAKHKQAWR